jgi:hypothetical protein
MQRLPVTGQLDGETLSRLSRGATSVGSNGSTGSAASAGSRAANAVSTAFSNPLLPSPVTVPTTITSGTVPFPLSTNVSLSPLPPPGTTIQP